MVSTMTSDPRERIDQYVRGVINAGELEILLVEAAGSGAAPGRIAAIAPAEIIRLIRERTAVARDTKWLRGGVVMVPRDRTPEQVRDHQERQARELHLWCEGLNRWREYFESLTE